MFDYKIVVTNGHAQNHQD